MNTSNIGAIQIVERFIKGECVIIGTIEMTDINEWWWTCYDASRHKEAYTYSPVQQGCAISRKESLFYVREEYREQLKQLKCKRIKTNE